MTAADRLDITGDDETLQGSMASVCDGRSTEPQRVQLGRRLRNEPAVRDQYLRYVDLHAALADEASPRVQSNLLDHPAGRQKPGAAARSTAWTRVAKWGPAIAAGIVLVAVLTSLAGRSTSPVFDQSASLPSRPAATTRGVATLLLAEDCRWRGPERTEGQRLAAESLELLAGTAVLRTDSGAELVMVGAVRLVLVAADRARVAVGDVVVRVTDGGEGFVVQTPTSEVIDLGTEFAVKVARSGRTEVHVLDGEVAYRELRAPVSQSRIMRAGEAVAVDLGDATSRSVPMNSPRFWELVDRINPASKIELLTAYEGFHYSKGTLPIDQSRSGKGWLGPWQHDHSVAPPSPTGCRRMSFWRSCTERSRCLGRCPVAVWACSKLPRPTVRINDA